MRTLSSAAIASMNAPQTDEVWLQMLVIEHSTLPEPLRFVADVNPLTSNAEVYVPYPFELEHPTEDPERAPEARLRIATIDQSVVIALRDMVDPPTMTIQLVLASAPDDLEMEITGLTLRGALWDQDWVTGTLRPEDLLSEPVSLSMTPQRLPGLF